MLMRLMKNRTLAAALLAPLVLAACESERGPMDPTSVRPQANLIVGGIQITKTAEGYNRSKVDYDWTLEKTVTPTSGSLAQGASATFQYTLTATRTLASSTTASTGVAGQICLTNTNTTTVTVNGVEDIIQKSVKGGPWEIVAITAVPLNGVTQIAGGQS